MIHTFGNIVLGTKKCPLCESTSLLQADFFCQNCTNKVIFPSGMHKFDNNPLIHSYSLFLYENFAAKCIKSFKFRGNLSLATYFQQCIRSNQLLLKDIFNDYDTIVTVPGKTNDTRLRGYDHTLIIARHLSKLLNIKISKGVIRRDRCGKYQRFLNSRQREKNVTKNYTINPHKKLNKQNILIVDDITTTGTTLKYIGKCLLNEGVSKVASFTLARTPL